MTASFTYVVVPPSTEWPEEHSEKRWKLTCNGFVLSALLHVCPGPLGVSTVSGSPIYRTRAELVDAGTAANWQRPAGTDFGVSDYCPLSWTLLGL